MTQLVHMMSVYDDKPQYMPVEPLSNYHIL